MRRWLTLVLVLLLLGLQYRLWVGEGSLAHVTRLQNDIETLSAANQRQAERNAVLADEVSVLKSGLRGIEEHAREELGMVKPGETFYMLIEQDSEEQP